MRLVILPLSLIALLCVDIDAASAEQPSRAKLQAAAAAARSVNGLCPVMGKVVVAKGGSVEYAGQRIGFCCPPCVAKFKKNPEKFMRRMRTEPAAYGFVATAR